MREVVQFLSDSEVYFDFSTRLLHLEDGTSVSLHDYQSDLLHLFASKPNTVISSRQIANPSFVKSPLPDNYHETLTADSDNAHARQFIYELRKLIPILKTLIQVKTRFGYVYIGNQLMQVADDWTPNSPNMVTTDIHESNINQAISVVDATDNAFPYEGDKPFVFVSYAHKNSKEVMDILNRLNDYGLRIWYDEGIEWGSEWPQSIAEHLKKCTIFLAFHSKDSVVSPNCRQEVAYAIKHRKTILSVYLEEVELPDGMDMQLTIYQAITKRDNETDKELGERLYNTAIIKNCMNNSIMETVRTTYQWPKSHIRIISISVFVLLILLFSLKVCFPQIVANLKYQGRDSTSSSTYEESRTQLRDSQAVRDCKDLNADSTSSLTYEELNKQLKDAQAAYDIAEEEYKKAVEDLEKAREAMDEFFYVYSPSYNSLDDDRRDVWKEKYVEASAEYEYRLSIRDEKEERFKEAKVSLEATKAALENANNDR